MCYLNFKVIVKASTELDDNDINLAKPVDPKVGVVAKGQWTLNATRGAFVFGVVDVTASESWKLS